MNKRDSIEILRKTIIEIQRQINQNSCEISIIKEKDIKEQHKDIIKNRVYKISTLTPYPVKDIDEFIYLTGLDIAMVEKKIVNLSNCGISNLIDINTLIKMDYFKY